MGARVIGVGAVLGGDDAVGLAVVARLRAIGVPRGVSLYEVQHPSALVSLLETTDVVVIVDAVVGAGRVGEVVELDAPDLGASAQPPASSHGLCVVQAFELARAVFGEGCSEPRIVGVCIAPPAARGFCGLSPPVADAVERAAALVLARIALKRGARASRNGTRPRGRRGTRARARSA